MARVKKDVSAGLGISEFMDDEIIENGEVTLPEFVAPKQKDPEKVMFICRKHPGLKIVDRKGNLRCPRFTTKIDLGTQLPVGVMVTDNPEHIAVVRELIKSEEEYLAKIEESRRTGIPVRPGEEYSKMRINLHRIEEVHPDLWKHYQFVDEQKLETSHCIDSRSLQGSLQSIESMIVS